MTDDQLQELVTSQIKSAMTPAKPRFDPTISLGSILTIGGMMASMAIGFLAFHDSLRDTERETASNTKAIAELKEVTQTISKTNSSLSNSMEKLTWIVDSIETRDKDKSK